MVGARCLVASTLLAVVRIHDGVTAASKRVSLLWGSTASMLGASWRLGGKPAHWVLGTIPAVLVEHGLPEQAGGVGTALWQPS